MKRNRSFRDVLLTLSEYLSYALVTVGLLLLTVDVANRARDALGLAGGGIVLIAAGFMLAGILGAVRLVADPDRLAGGA